MVRPAARREVARYLQERYEVSERRACHTIVFSRATLRYRSYRDPRTALRIRMRDIAYSRVRYGYRRVRVMLLREGWQISKNLVYRLYRGSNLAHWVTAPAAIAGAASSEGVTYGAEPCLDARFCIRSIGRWRALSRPHRARRTHAPLFGH